MTLGRVEDDDRDDRPVRGRVRRDGVRRYLRENDLTLVMLSLFAVCLVGQGIAGFRVYN